MDHQRFDDLTRTLARRSSGGLSRRSFARALAGAAAGLLVGQAGAAGAKDKTGDGLWKQKCKRAADCGLGAVCINNHCGCPPGLTICDAGTEFARCVDLMTAQNDCGECRLSCGFETCTNGQCDCGPLEDRCGEGGECYDTSTSHAHCGRCENACADDQRCVFGVCACPEGESPCQGPGGATVCRNTTSDPLNCGECGRVCADGQVCQGGACVCAADRVSCGGRCVDRLSDPANCGSCGNACAPGQTCLDGRCGCPDGQAYCGGACVDRQTDANNCGFCGRRCAECEQCIDGACLASGPGCCPTGQTACPGAAGFACCAADEECANGACRPKDECADGETPCVNGEGFAFCCPAGDQCCNGSCISTAELCCDEGDWACGDGPDGPICCGLGDVCCDGTCRPGPGPCCPAGQTACFDECIDTLADPNNCGGCGFTCDSCEVCQGGACVARPCDGCQTCNPQSGTCEDGCGACHVCDAALDTCRPAQVGGGYCEFCAADGTVSTGTACDDGRCCGADAECCGPLCCGAGTCCHGDNGTICCGPGAPFCKIASNSVPFCSANA